MQTSCVVDEKFIPKVGMIFKTLEEAEKFYKDYFKLAGFSTKIRNTTRDGGKIKNQLIVCSSEGMWKSKISPTLKTNPSVVKLFSKDLRTHNEGRRSLNNFQSRSESFTSLLSRLGRDSQTT
ncbi:hypothetical protein Ahy_A10g050790 [Arachis hypogaea]|uniref:FAR1 domain-containing protein n=1 Tax=Arachis hypogaea TaxID=3818 RepID=A0A445BAE1_ARAHY|nr:hypothetical protein Ahy_A10g050790 [Arachis hypogaea]